MNLVYMGLIEFPQEFVINVEVLGKEYVTQIGDTKVLIRMPVLDSDSGRKLEILKSPIESFEFNIDWGSDARRYQKDCQLIMKEYTYPMVAEQCQKPTKPIGEELYCEEIEVDRLLSEFQSSF